MRLEDIQHDLKTIRDLLVKVRNECDLMEQDENTDSRYRATLDTMQHTDHRDANIGDFLYSASKGLRRADMIIDQELQTKKSANESYTTAGIAKWAKHISDHAVTQFCLSDNLQTIDWHIHCGFGLTCHQLEMSTQCSEALDMKRLANNIASTAMATKTLTELRRSKSSSGD